MTYYFVSDLHVDFYAPMTRTVAILRKHFEAFFERNFLPADACCIAGDIANNYFTYVEFLKFIAEKYGAVYPLIYAVGACPPRCSVPVPSPPVLHGDNRFRCPYADGHSLVR